MVSEEKEKREKEQGKFEIFELMRHFEENVEVSLFLGGKSNLG